MKVRNRYTILINPMLGDAWWGGRNFANRVRKSALGTMLDCNLSELKWNIKALQDKGYATYQVKY